MTEVLSPVPFTADEPPSARKRQVLDAALALLVEGGEPLTMNGVARRASCSKETLYKWFGDRSGLLTATVQWQAAKVRAVPVDKTKLTAATLATALEAFANDLLGTLAGAPSVVLNRLAITHAGQEKSDLGRIVLENGRLTMGRRLKPLLDAARDKGLLQFDDAEAAFRTYFGLVVRDVQVRLLLGDALAMPAETVAAEAQAATTQFLALYGATPSSNHTKRGR